MPTYSGLRLSIDDSFPTNNMEFITAAILRTYLNNEIDQLGQLQVRGVATPGGIPDTINGPSAWFAYEVGVYSNFGGQTVAEGELKYIINNGEGSWSSQLIYKAANAPVTVTLSNGGSYEVPIGKLITHVTVSVATTQNVTVETGVGLNDIVYESQVTPTKVLTSTVGLDTQLASVTLFVRCSTQATLKIYFA